MSNTTSTPVVHISQLEEKVPYQGKTPEAYSLGTLIPGPMAQGVSMSLDMLEEVTGMSVAEFVSQAMQHDATEDVFPYLAAEQIDSVALALFNSMRDRPTLICNDTGTGKGRIGASLVKATLLQNLKLRMEDAKTAGKIPVFITDNPELFNDMLARDMVDVGLSKEEDLFGTVKPLVVNSDFSLNMTSKEGVFLDELKTPKKSIHEAKMRDVLDIYDATGGLGQYNMVIASYGQFNGKDSDFRRKFLSKISPSSFLILDEVHNIGGQAAAVGKRKERKESVWKDRDSVAREMAKTVVDDFLSSEVLDARKAKLIAEDILMGKPTVHPELKDAIDGILAVEGVKVGKKAILDYFRFVEKQGADTRERFEYFCTELIPKVDSFVGLSATAFKTPHIMLRLLASRSAVGQVDDGLMNEVGKLHNLRSNTGESYEVSAAEVFAEETAEHHPYLVATDEIAKKLDSAGIAAQQSFTQKLAMSGELMRVEKSMAGIEFETVPVPADTNAIDHCSSIMRELLELDGMKHDFMRAFSWRTSTNGIKLKDTAKSSGGIEDTNFSARYHNLAQAIELASIASSSGDAFIESIQSGRKPLGSLYFTMQSVIKEWMDGRQDEFFHEILDDYVASEENRKAAIEAILVDGGHDLRPGDIQDVAIRQQIKGWHQDAIREEAESRFLAWKNQDPAPIADIDFGYLLERQIWKSLSLTAVGPYEDDTYKISPRKEDLTPAVLKQVEKIQEMIRSFDWSNLPVSPIDAILQKTRDAGYRVEEMTGRTLGIDYSDSDNPRLKKIVQEQRNAVIAGYNNGEVDGILTNVSTGWSGHASRDVSDQRQRELIILQQIPDINRQVQMCGRNNRAGQLNPVIHEPDAYAEDGSPFWGQVQEKYPGIKPAFGLPLVKSMVPDGFPYVARQAARLNAKMASLEANTTGAKTEDESARFTDDEFIGNILANEVAVTVMADFPEIHRLMGKPLGDYDESKGRFPKQKDAAKKVTGRAIFLPIDKQEFLFERLRDRFKAVVLQREALGESPMKQDILDLQAETKARAEIYPSTGDSLFAGATWSEKVRMKALSKPFHPKVVAQRLLDRVDADSAWVVDAEASDIVAQLSDPDSTILSGLKESRTATYAQLENEIETYLDELRDRIDQLEDHQAVWEKLNDNYKNLKVGEKEIAAQVEAIEARLSTPDADQQQVLDINGDDASPTVQPLTAVERIELEGELEALKTQLGQAQELTAAANTEQKEFGDNGASLVNTQQRVKGLEGRRDNVLGLFRRIQLGHSVRIGKNSDGTVMYGMVTGITRNDRVKSPMAGGAWEFEIAVVDMAKELRIRLGDVKGIYSDDFGLDFDPTTTGNFWDDGEKKMLNLRIPEMLLRSQDHSYEMREFITGNTFRVDNQTLAKGKLVSFTTADGRIRQGVLMKRGYSVKRSLEAVPVTIDDPDVLVRAVDMSAVNPKNDRREQLILRTPDGVLSIRKSVQASGKKGKGGWSVVGKKDAIEGYAVSVKPGHRLTKNYLANQAMTDLFRDELGESGMQQIGRGKKSTWRGFLPEDNLNEFMELFPSMVVDQALFKPWARREIGQTIPEMEDITVDDLELEALELSGNIEGIRTRLQKVSDFRQLQEDAAAQRQVKAFQARDAKKAEIEAQALEASALRELAKTGLTKGDTVVTHEDIDAALDALASLSQEQVDQVIAESVSHHNVQRQEQWQMAGNGGADTLERGFDEELLISGFVEHFQDGGSFKSIVQARKFAHQHLVGNGFDCILSDKVVDEAIEKSIVVVSRDLLHDASDPEARLDAFDSLLELYDDQPNLSSRTSTSFLNQQYSTPVPLGLLVQQLAGIQPDDIVYEPTVGNGALVSGVDLKNIIANEIDPDRAAATRRQGITVSEQDATQFKPESQVDVVVANPPFGKTQDRVGNTISYQIDLNGNPANGTKEYETTAVDHAIAFKSLAAMKDDGRAVLVVGAPMAQKREWRDDNPEEAYLSDDKRSFYHTLYGNYNVIDHFSVTGNLYAKQGTSFPVDVIVIEGRGQSQLPLPYVQAPRTYNQWDQLRVMMAQTIEQRQFVAENVATINQLNSLLERDPVVVPTERVTEKTAVQLAQERLALMSAKDLADKRGILEEDAQSILNFIEWDIARQLDSSADRHEVNAIAQTHGYPVELVGRAESLDPIPSFESALGETLDSLSGQSYALNPRQIVNKVEVTPQFTGLDVVELYGSDAIGMAFIEPSDVQKIEILFRKEEDHSIVFDERRLEVEVNHFMDLAGISPMDEWVKANALGATSTESIIQLKSNYGQTYGNPEFTVYQSWEMDESSGNVVPGSFRISFADLLGDPADVPVFSWSPTTQHFEYLYPESMDIEEGGFDDNVRKAISLFETWNVPDGVAVALGRQRDPNFTDKIFVEPELFQGSDPLVVEAVDVLAVEPDEESLDREIEAIEVTQISNDDLLQIEEEDALLQQALDAEAELVEMAKDEQVASPISAQARGASSGRGRDLSRGLSGGSDSGLGSGGSGGGGDRSSSTSMPSFDPNGGGGGNGDRATAQTVERGPQISLPEMAVASRAKGQAVTPEQQKELELEMSYTEQLSAVGINALEYPAGYIPPDPTQAQLERLTTNAQIPENAGKLENWRYAIMPDGAIAMQSLSSNHHYLIQPDGEVLTDEDGKTKSFTGSPFNSKAFLGLELESESETDLGTRSVQSFEDVLQESFSEIFEHGLETMGRGEKVTYYAYPNKPTKLLNGQPLSADQDAQVKVAQSQAVLSVRELSKLEAELPIDRLLGSGDVLASAVLKSLPIGQSQPQGSNLKSSVAEPAIRQFLQQHGVDTPLQDQIFDWALVFEYQTIAIDTGLSEANKFRRQQDVASRLSSHIARIYRDHEVSQQFVDEVEVVDGDTVDQATTIANDLASRIPRVLDERPQVSEISEVGSADATDVSSSQAVQEDLADLYVAIHRHTGESCKVSNGYLDQAMFSYPENPFPVAFVGPLSADAVNTLVFNRLSGLDYETAMIGEDTLQFAISKDPLNRHVYPTFEDYNTQNKQIKWEDGDRVPERDYFVEYLQVEAGGSVSVFVGPMPNAEEALKLLRSIPGDSLPKLRQRSGVDIDIERFESSRLDGYRVVTLEEYSLDSPAWESEQPVAIAPWGQQKGKAAKYVAKLLHDAGLAEAVLSGEDFHLRDEPDNGVMPLVIERHPLFDDQISPNGEHDAIYLTHYFDQGGDRIMDNEMVFVVNKGEQETPPSGGFGIDYYNPNVGAISLVEVMQQDPIRGGERRTRNTTGALQLANMFAENLNSQGHAEFLEVAWAKTQSEPEIEPQEANHVEIESVSTISPSEMLQAEASARTALAEENANVLMANRERLKKFALAVHNRSTAGENVLSPDVANSKNQLLLGLLGNDKIPVDFVGFDSQGEAELYQSQHPEIFGDNNICAGVIRSNTAEGLVNKNPDSRSILTPDEFQATFEQSQLEETVLEQDYNPIQDLADQYEMSVGDLMIMAQTAGIDLDALGDLSDPEMQNTLEDSLGELAVILEDAAIAVQELGDADGLEVEVEEFDNRPPVVRHIERFLQETGVGELDGPTFSIGPVTPKGRVNAPKLTIIQEDDQSLAVSFDVSNTSYHELRFSLDAGVPKFQSLSSVVGGILQEEARPHGTEVTEWVSKLVETKSDFIGQTKEAIAQGKVKRPIPFKAPQAELVQEVGDVDNVQNQEVIAQADYPVDVAAVIDTLRSEHFPRLGLDERTDCIDGDYLDRSMPLRVSDDGCFVEMSDSACSCICYHPHRLLAAFQDIQSTEIASKFDVLVRVADAEVELQQEPLANTQEAGGAIAQEAARPTTETGVESEPTIAEAPDSEAAVQKLPEAAFNSRAIASREQHKTWAAKRIANLLHEAGVDQAIAGGNEFTLNALDTGDEPALFVHRRGHQLTVGMGTDYSTGNQETVKFSIQPNGALKLSGYKPPGTKKFQAVGKDKSQPNALTRKISDNLELYAGALSSALTTQKSFSDVVVKPPQQAIPAETLVVEASANVVQNPEPPSTAKKAQVEKATPKSQSKSMAQKSGIGFSAVEVTALLLQKYSPDTVQELKELESQNETVQAFKEDVENPPYTPTWGELQQWRDDAVRMERGDKYIARIDAISNQLLATYTPPVPEPIELEPDPDDIFLLDDEKPEPILPEVDPNPPADYSVSSVILSEKALNAMQRDERHSRDVQVLEHAKIIFEHLAHGAIEGKNGDRILQSSSGDYALTESLDGSFKITDIENRTLLVADAIGTVDYKFSMTSKEDLESLFNTRKEIEKIVENISNKIKSPIQNKKNKSTKRKMEEVSL